jgi:hypothetical protein
VRLTAAMLYIVRLTAVMLYIVRLTAVMLYIVRLTAVMLYIMRLTAVMLYIMRLTVVLLYAVRLTVIQFMYMIFPKLVRISLQINFQASFVFFRLFSVLLLEQLADMLEVFTVLLVLSSTPPKYQQAAPTYCTQLGLLYILYTEEFPILYTEEFPFSVPHVTDQYFKHPFHTITVLPDDGPVRPKTHSS